MAPPYRFVDGDTFARFDGIGIGCQKFQATRTLSIQVGSDFTADTSNSQSDDEDSDREESEGSKSEGNESEEDESDGAEHN